MQPASRRRGDIIVAAVLAAFAVALLLGEVHRAPASAAAAFGAVAVLTAALVVRRSHPFASLGALTAVQAGLIVAVWSPAAAPAVLVGLYTVATLAPIPLAVAAAAATTAVLAGAEFAATRWGGDGNLVPLVLLSALGLAIGLTVRYQRAFVAEALARVQAAEAGAEADARRAVADDRLRIARDLHDSLAHHMAVVNLQSAAARRLLSTDAVAADAAIAQVQSAARAAIADAADVVGTLRQPAPVTPQLAAGPDLGGVVVAAGGSVDADVSTLTGLPDDVQVLAHRVLREALTNAARHAPGAAVTIRARRAGDTVRLEVRNAASLRPASPDPSGGHGLAGMRERLAARGGTLTAGPQPGGGYALAADIPLAHI